MVRMKATRTHATAAVANPGANVGGAAGIACPHKVNDEPRECLLFGGVALAQSQGLHSARERLVRDRQLLWRKFTSAVLTLFDRHAAARSCES